MMSPLEEAFTILVSSTKSMNVFTNDSSSFSNMLGRSLDVSEYNVAMRSMIFYDNFKPLPSWESTIVEHKVAPLETFFKQRQIDDKIVLTRLLKEVVVLTNNATNLALFTTYVNEVFLQYDMHAHIVLTISSTIETTAAGNPEVVVTYNLAKLSNFDLNNFEIEIPKSLARLWGFTRTVFPVGDYYSHLPITESRFKSIRNGETFPLEKKKFEKTPLYMGQLMDPTLEDVMLEMSVSVRRGDGLLMTNIDEDYLTLEYSLEPEGSTLALSPFLKEYLGLKKYDILSGHQTIPVSAHIVRPYSEKYINRRDFIEKFNLSQLLVLTNAIDEVLLYNSKFLNCISIVDREEGTDKRVYRPKKLTFYPATKAILNHISVKLIDDTGHILPAVERPTTVELYFQKSPV